MTGKLKLDQIPYGTLNNISDAGGPSTDRRRTDPLEFLRLSTEEAYSRNALRNKDSFEGIIIAKQLIAYPSVKNKSALFKDYILKEAQKAEASENPAKVSVEGADPAETDDYPTFIYKVYIPEIEPRPIPRGTDDPIIATYADVHSDVNNVENGLPIGTLVRVIYEDVGTLYGPKISSVVGPPIQLAGFETSQSLDAAFKSGIPLPLDGAVPERKLLSSEIKNFADARPDFTGLTPNADKLRAALTALGYKEKGTELSNAGDITAKMADVGISVFKEIKKQLPSVAIRVTGGNDKYHKVIADAKMYRSRHVDGVALDFVFSPVNSANESALLRILQGYSAMNGPFRFKDEYKTLTSAASGQHFHFSYRAGGKEGLDEQAASKALLAKGDIKGYTIGGGVS
jgi:hypothetical protein